MVRVPKRGTGGASTSRRRTPRRIVPRNARRRSRPCSDGVDLPPSSPAADRRASRKHRRPGDGNERDEREDRERLPGYNAVVARPQFSPGTAYDVKRLADRGGALTPATVDARAARPATLLVDLRSESFVVSRAGCPRSPGAGSTPCGRRPAPDCEGSSTLLARCAHRRTCQCSGPARTTRRLGHSPTRRRAQRRAVLVPRAACRVPDGGGGARLRRRFLAPRRRGLRGRRARH